MAAVHVVSAILWTGSFTVARGPHFRDGLATLLVHFEVEVDVVSQCGTAD